MRQRSTTNAAIIRDLADLLKRTDIGATVTFSEMDKATGYHVKRDYPFLIPAARKLANQETGALFDSVRGEGYVRLPNESTDAVGAKIARRSRRGLNRGVTMLGNTVRLSNDMSPEAVLQTFARMNQLGLAAAMLRGKPRFSEAALWPDKAPEPTDAAKAAVKAMLQNRDKKYGS